MLEGTAAAPASSRAISSSSMRKASTRLPDLRAESWDRSKAAFRARYRQAAEIAMTAGGDALWAMAHTAPTASARTGDRQRAHARADRTAGRAHADPRPQQRPASHRRNLGEDELVSWHWDGGSTSIRRARKDTVNSIQAMHDGRIKVFVGMGRNCRRRPTRTTRLKPSAGAG